MAQGVDAVIRAAVVLWAGTLGGIGSAASQTVPPDLPLAVTNNAVAGGRAGDRSVWYSMMGIDSTKAWSGISTRAFRWTDGDPTWTELPRVPGTVGRLAATAQIVRGRVYLFGGYTVSATGAERSVPEVDVFDPAIARWTVAAPIPIPVDDAVSGVYRDSLVYLVSGWHDTDNVAAVQIYDAVRDRWTAGTPFPGTAVFGHTGGLIDGALLVTDGAKRIPGPVRYALEPQAWLGRIDPEHPTSIVWEKVADHPGPPRYRAAGGGCGRSTIVIAGGTANPYNYNGIGYNGAASEPEPGSLAFDVRSKRWRTLPAPPAGTMDHRGLLVDGVSGWVIGGMAGGQRVTAGVVRYPLPGC